MLDEQTEAPATDAADDVTDPEASANSGDEGEAAAEAATPAEGGAPEDAEASAEPEPEPVEAEAPAEPVEAEAPAEPVEAEAPAEPVEAEAPAEPAAESADVGGDDDADASVAPEVQEFIGQDTTVVHDGAGGGPLASPYRTPPGIPSGLDPGTPDDRSAG